MKSQTLVSLLFLAAIGFARAEEPKFESIFNGKDLTGWVAPENNIWWKANNGVLEVRSGPDKKGSNLWTEKSYKNFVIECEFKFGEGIVDSGLFMRTEKDQIQIGISGSLKRDMTGSPYVTGKYPQEAQGVATLLKQSDWNTFKVQAVGNTYTVWLNGTQVIAFDSPTAIESGPIGIQLHGNRDMNIDYRNIRVAELP